MGYDLGTSLRPLLVVKDVQPNTCNSSRHCTDTTYFGCTIKKKDHFAPTQLNLEDVNSSWPKSDIFLLTNKIDLILRIYSPMLYSAMACCRAEKVERRAGMASQDLNKEKGVIQGELRRQLSGHRWHACWTDCTSVGREGG